MLNGVDPIIIFNFKKLTPGSLAETISRIPLVASVVSAIDLPAIPIYLSERLTGIYIDSENKSIEIDTSIDTLTNGGEPSVNQKALSSTVKIEMQAAQGSIGISLFSALADLILPKVSSKEYSITYLHGAVTVFGGWLHSFAITQASNSTLYTISLELTNPSRSFLKAVDVPLAKDTASLTTPPGSP